MTDILKRIQYGCWLYLSRVVDWLHPGYVAAEVTVGRVQRFYELLKETEYDAVPTRQPERPAGPVDSSAQAEAVANQQQKRQEKARELKLHFMDEGRLAEVTELIVHLRPWESAEDVPAHVVTRALAHFTMAYTKHMRALTGIDV